jgi:hypothetical protein
LGTGGLGKNGARSAAWKRRLLGAVAIGALPFPLSMAVSELAWGQVAATLPEVTVVAPRPAPSPPRRQAPAVRRAAASPRVAPATTPVPSALPAYQVIATTPVTGIGFDRNKVPAMAQTVTAEDFSRVYSPNILHDTITGLGFVFTPDQRDAIFATASVEKIVDTSGAYTASPPDSPPPDPPPPSNSNVFTLTVGADAVVGSAADDTVNGTAATLYAGDSLAGGAGTDVLALYGSGTFRVDQLATFSGFESITLNNFTNGSANLYLGSQPMAVTGYGSGSEQLYLGSGAVTFYGGSSGYNYVTSTSASNWNASNVIDGGSQYHGYLYLNWNGAANTTYDLTTNTLTHIEYLYGSGSNLTRKINSADAAGVANFYGQGNDQLVTSDAALDLSHSKVSGFTVASTNATGTTFTVQDIGTAFQIAGGAGQDTITALALLIHPK